MNKTERSNEPTIFSLSENDKEMNDAIETAINNLNEFDSALKKSEYENFALKIKYDYEKGSEYIWATDIIKQENDYFGIIDILQKWNNRKQLERLFKGAFVANRNSISVAHPKKYAKRFKSFLKKLFVYDDVKTEM